MASNIGLNKSKQMERLTMCSICLDKFRIPKVLPCMHTFCLAPCLSNLVEPKARSLRCPECRREHPIPQGGIQAFPSNLTMVGLMDLQQPPPPPLPSIQPPTVTITRTAIDFPDRCFICKQQKQTLIECHDCSKFICTNCRESHLRDAFYNVSSSVNQLRRGIPKLSEKLGSYQQRVINVQTNFEQIREEIMATVANMINELKHRETILLNEAEIYRQSQLRNFRIQQETAQIELTNAVSFCDSVGTSYPNGQLVNESDIANIRSECDRLSQQIDNLQIQIPNIAPKLRFIFDNQMNVLSSIKNFGNLIDTTLQRPQFSSAAYPQTSTRYTPAPQTSRSNQYRYFDNVQHLQNGSNSQVSALSQTISYRPTSRNMVYTNNDLSQTLPARTNVSSRVGGAQGSQERRRSLSNVQSNSVFGSNPFSNNNTRSRSQPPTGAEQSAPEVPPRRNFLTSMTAARSLEGDDRPIFGGAGGGGGGRGAMRFPMIAPIPEHEPFTNNLQRQGTFALDEPSLPNLPQSGAQKPRDKVNIKDLYKVRRQKRAKTPVAFTIDLNSRPPSNATEIIDNVS